MGEPEQKPAIFEEMGKSLDNLLATHDPHDVGLQFELSKIRFSGAKDLLRQHGIGLSNLIWQAEKADNARARIIITVNSDFEDFLLSTDAQNQPLGLLNAKMANYFYGQEGAQQGTICDVTHERSYILEEDGNVRVVKFIPKDESESGKSIYKIGDEPVGGAFKEIVELGTLRDFKNAAEAITRMTSLMVKADIRARELLRTIEFPRIRK